MLCLGGWERTAFSLAPTHNKSLLLTPIIEKPCRRDEPGAL